MRCASKATVFSVAARPLCVPTGSASSKRWPRGWRYTLGERSALKGGCNTGFALIEAVQIEGHTDADGGDMSNLILSTARANDTFRVMTEHVPTLVGHLNLKSQPVLSVAGYGEMRPVAPNESNEGKASNRRIDLRIIMYVPAHSEEIARVREALQGGSAFGEP
jgi:hypothetical protein